MTLKLRMIKAAKTTSTVYLTFTSLHLNTEARHQTRVSFCAIHHLHLTDSITGTVSIKLAVVVPSPPVSSLITTLLAPTKLGHNGDNALLKMEGFPVRVKEVQYPMISSETGTSVLLNGAKKGTVPLDLSSMRWKCRMVKGLRCSIEKIVDI